MHLVITDLLYKKQQPKFCEEDEEITDYDDVSKDIIDESVENSNNDLNTNIFEGTNIIFELEENMEIIDLTEDFQGVIKNLQGRFSRSYKKPQKNYKNNKNLFCQKNIL